MSTPLEQLVGQRVTVSRIVHDYAQILFENAGLTIYNDYTVNGCKTLVELKGLGLSSVSANDEQVLLTFEDGTAIRVDLRSDAYHCAETNTPSFGRRI